jgi:lysophospholipase L1-like esterase
MHDALTAQPNFIRRTGAASSAIFDRVVTIAGLLGSLTLLPIAMVQGAATRRRVPILPPPKGEYEGYVAGVGTPIRLLAIGESSVSGIGLSHSEETVAAVTARALGRSTNRPVIWQALGLSGGTVRAAIEQLLPRVRSDSVDILVVAFGVNDATSYRSPTGYADDLAALVTEVRSRVGNAPVVLAGVAPLNSFPALR